MKPSARREVARKGHDWPGVRELTTSSMFEDTTGLIDPTGGIGGYRFTAEVVAALTGDGHGGTLLALGGATQERRWEIHSPEMGVWFNAAAADIAYRPALAFDSLKSAQARCAGCGWSRKKRSISRDASGPSGSV